MTDEEIKRYDAVIHERELFRAQKFLLEKRWAWIKCSARMPPENVTVLIYSGMVETAFATYKDGVVKWWDNLRRHWNDGEVTHWMFAPEVPKD